jgi:hypothetical protein
MNAKITGTFVDFSIRTHQDEHLLNWDENQWATEFAEMKAAGIDTVIPARAMRWGQTYYHSKVFATFDERDTLTPFMRAAGKTGMKVYLTGFLNMHFFSGDVENFQRMMIRDQSIYRTLYTEQFEQFADVAEIAGFYVAHEPDYDNCSLPGKQEALLGFMRQVYQDAKEIADLPVMTSPFFSHSQPPDVIAAWWDSLLGERICDIVAMQDGVGCVRNITPASSLPVFEALAPVFARRGVEFWHNLECFVIDPRFSIGEYDRQFLILMPAPTERLDEQYRTHHHLVSKTITWEYGHSYSRTQTGPDWHNAFSNWNRGNSQ